MTDDKYEPINPPAEFKRIADEVLRKFAESLNIPRELVTSGNGNYSQAKVHEQAWLRRFVG